MSGLPVIDVTYDSVSGVQLKHKKGGNRRLEPEADAVRDSVYPVMMVYIS